MSARLIEIDPWAGEGPRFNRTAADAVYKAMTAMDDESALVYGRLLVAGSLEYDMVAHRSELARAADEVVTKRAGALHRYYTRTAVAKARRGEDSTPEIAALVQISKAGFDFTPEERRRYVSQQTRGQGGRFVQQHHRINTNPSKPPEDDARALKVRGIPIAEDHLQAADRAHYQQAYGQIQDLLAPFHNPDLNARLHLQIHGRDGEVREEQHEVPRSSRASGKKAPGIPISANLKPGDRIESAAVSVDPLQGRAGTAAFDVLAAAHAPRAGGYVSDAYDGGALDAVRLKTFNEDRIKAQQDENQTYSGATRSFGRLERGSKLLQDSLGDTAPRHLQYALAVANHVGQYGPEAQKVIGPVADRAAYRYRGTERAPDPKLRNAFNSLHSFDRLRSDYGGATARQVAIMGAEDPKNGWNPGPVLGYFRGRLPDADLNELQRRSGVIPPSEGIVIGANGAVAHQAVGYADDWYLPFNLRHLGSLKGGEYIRTRSFGGPTTEDIYTGLVSGARSMTVVSHNGVYTVDFDRNLRGGRRFNDKAARMVGRYGQLLDALRSEQVGRGSISSSRMAELRDRALDYDPDETSDAFANRMRELQTEERRRPKLSRLEQGEAAADWLGELAANSPDHNGRTLSTEQMVDQFINTRARAAHKAHVEGARQMGVDPMRTLADYQKEERDALQVGDSAVDQIAAIADVAGLRPSFDRAMKRAEQANRDSVRSLRLDGEGYNDALNALHEQFPYYIAKPVYHPWRNAQGVGNGRTLEHAPDTGYVAPRFNRPQAAEAGYFNERVTGQGKVEAQTTRYQNFPVGQGRLKPVGQRPRDAAGRNGTSGGGTGTDAGKSRLTPDESQRLANDKLLDEILSKTTFEDGAKLSLANGQTVEFPSMDIKRYATEQRFPNASFRKLFTMDRSEIDAMPVKDVTALLTDVLPLLTGPNKLISVSDEARDAFKNKGAVSPSVEMPDTLGDRVRARNTNFKFEGAAYDPSRSVEPEIIERVFEGEKTIDRLINRNELAPITASTEVWEQKLRSLKQKLTEADKQHLNVKRQGGREDRVKMQQDMRDAEGMLRAQVLRQRWVDADSKPAGAPGPQGPLNQSITEYHFNGTKFDPADLAEYMKRKPVQGQPNNVIDGT